MNRRTRSPGLLPLAPCLLLVLDGCAGTMREESGAVNYTPGASYHMMMAEIAAQRGEHQTAVQEYLATADRGDDPEAARRATEYAFDFGYDGLAQRGAERWLALAPDSSSAREYLGRLALRRHDLAGAREHFAVILGPPGTRSGLDYLVLEGELADEINASGVTRLLVWLGAGEPPTPEYRLAVARAAYRSREDELALGWARLAAATSDSLEAELLIGRVLYSAGHSDAALRHLADLLQARPLPLIELEFVRLLASSRRETAALQALERLIDAYGRQSELLLLRARTLLSVGEDAEAAAEFRELADAGQSVYECFYYLAQIAAENDDREEGLRQYSRIGAGAYFLAAQFKIAELYADSDDLDAGLAHLKNFAKAHPRYAFEVVLGTAQLLERRGRDEAALAAYDDALRFKPKDPGLLLARGIVRDRLGQTRKAVSDMRRAQQLSPFDSGILNALGYTLTNRGRRHGEGYALIRLALEQDPENPAILDSMGWVLFRRGENDVARAYLQLAYDKLPDPEVAAHLGEVLWTLGERDQARRIWQEATIAYPDSQPLLETTARFPR
ncbi:MAG: tetratricopeptide repeat protein [Chromatiales bacterium]|nr:MAG: tetratricopeptide repeat protein [Chromatiales bacterium]